jgi:HAD superfamily hydrolase (TIGR01509 family)
MIKVLLFDFFGVLYDGKELNIELLDFLRKLKGKYELVILTSSYYAVNNPKIKKELDKVFAKYFFSKDLGVTKEDEECYLQIAGDLSVAPAEILFVDDWRGRAKAARDAGCEAVIFKDNENFFNDYSHL